jgi:hypothetical protein
MSPDRLLGILLFLGACVSSTEEGETMAAPSEADLRARDECLQSYICSATSQNPNPSELKRIGAGADGKCSVQVEEKIRGHYGAEGDDLVARDRDFTQQRAMNLAAQWDDICR